MATKRSAKGRRNAPAKSKPLYELVKGDGKGRARNTRTGKTVSNRQYYKWKHGGLSSERHAEKRREKPGGSLTSAMKAAIERDYAVARARERGVDAATIKTQGGSKDAKRVREIRRALSAREKRVGWDYTKRPMPGDSKAARELQRIRNEILVNKGAVDVKAMRRALAAVRPRGKGKTAKELRKAQGALRAALANVDILNVRFKLLVELGRVSPEQRSDYITRWLGG